MYIKFINKKLIFKTFIISACIFAFWWISMYFITPKKLFKSFYSTLLYDSSGNLLGARIADDGQWRFPQSRIIPDRFVKCLITYEDKRFFYHFGIDPISLLRAIKQNISSGSKVSGGSTITMQIARQSLGNKARTIFQKIMEVNMALYLETVYSKEQLLTLYCSHAPFGGNVVGLEAAAWRYFARPAADLSWAESATLAVLPNSPALIHPGRNKEKLISKRNKLLKKLYEAAQISKTDYELAIMEPLPDNPETLPNETPHLINTFGNNLRGTKINTTINEFLQKKVQNIVNNHANQFLTNHIHNAAALVADIETGNVLAYVGNVTFKADEVFGNDVDMISAARSTGSILKPVLYAAMLNNGQITPNSLVPDIPLNINGFVPQNYSKTFMGAVPASLAIVKSLNVPLVRMLSKYHTGRFLELLRELGITTLTKNEDYYGASLILGGAEAKLWDICGMYASMARILNHYKTYNGLYDKNDVHPLNVFQNNIFSQNKDEKLTETPPFLSCASIWFMCKAMSGLNRPEEEADWQQFGSMKKIAWKTGTSFGNRDAWSVGFNSKYIVGVWVGNASGESRAGLTGVGYAAPVLFHIFSLLPQSEWFKTPYDEMCYMPICRQSGYKASQYCENLDTLLMPVSAQNSVPCPYHKLIHLSEDGKFRVNSSCEPVSKICTQSWFVLPPAQEYYYKLNNADYKMLPPFKPGCADQNINPIDVIYPENGAVIHLPKGFSGITEQAIFTAAHHKSEAVLYWHLDNVFLGETKNFHKITCKPKIGKHLLTIVDDDGNIKKVYFNVK